MGACKVTPHMDADLTCRENLVLVGLMCGLPKLIARPQANRLLVRHGLDAFTIVALEDLPAAEATRLQAAADELNEIAGQINAARAERVA